jgi:GTP pyrophosphokinase
MRQRIARFGSSRPQTPALDPLFRIIRANHAKADLGLIERHTAPPSDCTLVRRGRAGMPSSPIRSL